ncbi:MAG: hypothetical protein NHB15_04000 [Methanosarcina barkeri]|nr:hypothetical protein [Methanosarcina sp. ERenArc_MAG2]
MKKYIYVIFFIFLASMLAVGCTGLKDNNNASQAVYQDTAWRESIHTYTELLGTDFKNVQIAIDNTNNSDYTKLATIGQNISDHSQAALTENNQYTVSPQFRDTQKEWGLALEDSNSAGKYVIIVANDIKNGDMNSKLKDLQKYMEARNSMKVHLNETTTLMKAAYGKT